MSGSLLIRFRRWVIIAIAFGAILYLVGSVLAGLGAVTEAMGEFVWPYMVPVVGLTLLNYSLRFVKWHYLLGKLGVQMPLKEDIWNFAAGLAMVISPGKAGELLKPYVVRERTGAPMAQTIPALVTERLTDGIAMLILAGLGVTTYASDKIHYLTVPAVMIVAGLLVLASKRRWRRQRRHRPRAASREATSRRAPTCSRLRTPTTPLPGRSSRGCARST